MTQWKQRPWTLGESSPISLLFAVLLDLIICRTTKMGLFVPSRAAGRPKCRIRRDGSQDQGRQALEIAFWRKILAYLKWLIYSAAFKGPTAEPHGSIHAEFTEDGTERFEPVKILSAESRRSSWIAGMPRICKEKKHSCPKNDDNYMGASEGEHEQLLKIYHDGDDSRQPVDASRLPAGVFRWWCWKLKNGNKFFVMSRLSVMIDLDWQRWAL